MADLPDNYNLHYNLGGYLKYELSDNMSGTLVPRGRVGEQAHGISQFIFSSSGTFDLYKFGNSFLSGTNNATVEELEDEEIHTYLNTYVTGSGVLTSGTISNFFADDGEYKLVNIAGRQIVRSTKDYYEIATYDSIFANKLAGVKLQSGTVTISGTLVNIVSSGTAESFDVITMLDQTGSTNVTLQNDNGELTVAGDMDITGDFTVAGTTYLQSVVTEVTDPILLLGAGTSASHTTDRGIEFKYYNGSVKSGFFGYNQDNERFVYLLDATNSSETITGTLGMIDVGGIYVSGSQKNNIWDTAYSWGDHSTAGYAASSHSHSLAHSSLTGIGTSDHHIRYTDTEAIDAIESLSLQSATSSDYVIFSGSSGLGKIAFSSLDENILTDIKTYVDNSVANSDTFAELNDVSVVPNENDFVVYSGSNWVDRTPAQVKDILGLGSTSSPTFDDVTITGTVTLSGDAIINETNATNNFTFQIGGTDIFSVTSDGIQMAGWPESDYEFLGDIDGGIRFEVKAGEDLSKGDVVYISGALGDNTIVSKAKANSASTMPAFGLMLETVSNGNIGQVVTFGNLYGSGGAPLDTSTFAVGDVLYVSPTTAGEYTKTKPTGEGNLLQNIGKIIRVASSNGVIKVGGAGRANDTPNLNDGNIFIGNASNQVTTSTLDTSIVPENTNLYYTDTRARNAVSASPSSDLSYNSATGVFSFTETHLSTAGSYDYLSVNDHAITLGQIDLTTDVTGVLPSANMDADTAHLSTAQTFTGAKQFNEDVTLYHSDNSATVNPILILKRDGTQSPQPSGEFGQIKFIAPSYQGTGDNEYAKITQGIAGTWYSNSGWAGKLLFNLKVYNSSTDTYLDILELNGGNNATDPFVKVDADFTVTGDITVNGTVDGVDIAARDHDAVTLVTTSHDYLSISTQAITLGAIDLTTDVTGVLPDANVANDITLDNITQITNRAHSSLGSIGASDHHTKYALTDDLASGEITQLQNIGSATISATQWGYVGALDQNLITTSDVTFNSLSLTGNLTSYVNADSIITFGASTTNTYDKGIAFIEGSGTFGTTGNYGLKIYYEPSANIGYFQMGEDTTVNTFMQVARSTGVITFPLDTTFSADTDFNGIVRLSADGSASDNFLSIGDGDDLKIYHDSNDTRIRNFTGNLVIRNEGDDKDIIFQNDDNSGGVTDWIALDGSEFKTLFKVDTRHQDNIKAYFGSGNDVEMYFDGTSFRLESVAGEMQFSQTVNDGIIRFYNDNGSGGIATYLTLDGSSEGIYAYKKIGVIADGSSSSEYLFVGAGQDLKLYHTSSDSYIINSTGGLYLENTVIDGGIFLRADKGGSQANYIWIDGSDEQIKMYADVVVSGDVSGTTIGGITEANLLDKSATETVSGAYTFSSTLTASATVNISNGGATGTGSFSFDGRSDLGMYANNYHLRLASPGGVTINLDANSNDTNSSFTVAHDNNTWNPSSNLLLDIGENGTRFGGSGARVTTVLDEDAMGSNSATALATQQSIKAYVDSQVATANELSELTDVTLGGTVSNGDLLVYSGSPNDYWTNTKTLSGDYTLDGLTVDNITINGNDITISETGTSDVPQFKIDSAGHVNIALDRGSTSYDANLMFQTAGSTKWRLWLDGADTTLAIRDEAQSNDLVTFTSNSGMTIDGSLTLGTSTAVSSILDEDTMSSNSATALATQQSIKAYVDANAGTSTMYESYTDIGVGGQTAQSSLTVTTAPTDARVYVDGIKMRPNTNSTSWDYDFYRPSTTTIQFTADLPNGSVVAMEWIA